VCERERLDSSPFQIEKYKIKGIIVI